MPLAAPANATAAPKAHALTLLPSIFFPIHCPVFSMGKDRRKECRSIPTARMPLSWLHGLRLPKILNNSNSLKPLNISSIIRHSLHYYKAPPYKQPRCIAEPVHKAVPICHAVVSPLRLPFHIFPPFPAPFLARPFLNINEVSGMERTGASDTPVPCQCQSYSTRQKYYIPRHGESIPLFLPQPLFPLIQPPGVPLLAGWQYNSSIPAHLHTASFLPALPALSRMHARFHKTLCSQ